MTVKVLFFGLLKDVTGRAEDRLVLADGARLDGVFRHYADAFPKIGEMSRSIVMARNHEFAELSSPVADGDEIAFLPPVSGGAEAFTHQVADPEGHFFGLTRQPIDSRALAETMRRGEDGAVIVFEGVVRNNSKGRTTLFLDYECYEAMAIRKIAEIGRAIAASMPIGHIAIVHRLGRMEIGEASVAVVVSAPHRKPAFDAALEGINRLKKLVPIWKKEHFSDGEVWVEGEWDDRAPLAAKS
jgi:molybdopterin synthase catalytic subunit/molybdopterin converting factor small subunit